MHFLKRDWNDRQQPGDSPIRHQLGMQATAKALFNTLEAAEILADAGIEDRKAQAMVKMTHEAVSHSVATKGDLDKLAGRVDGVESELARRLDRVESLVKEESSKTHAKISETEAKIAKLGQELGDRISNGFMMTAGLIVGIAGLILVTAIAYLAMAN